MTKKNQIPQANDSSNRIIELSDEDLQQVGGGIGILTFIDGKAVRIGANTDFSNFQVFLTS